MGNLTKSPSREVLDSSGLNPYISPKDLEKLPIEELRQAFLELQDQNVANMQEIIKMREQMRDDDEWLTLNVKALRIQHARVNRLLQTIQDFMGKEARMRIYAEMTPDIVRVATHTSVEFDLVEPEAIIEELRRLATE